MSSAKSFHSEKKFYALDRFPYGLDKCGEFTRDQVSLLVAHGHAYEGLHKESRQPINNEEERFVKVCKGLEAPESVHEKVWDRFCKKASEDRSPRSLPGGGIFSSSSSSSDDFSDMDMD